MSLLPPNASALESALEEAVQIPALPVAIRALWHPETCPESLLPWLAWTLSIDGWDASWPLAVRRAVVASAIAVHRRKGTVFAVRKAIAAFGANMSLREWYQIAPPDPAGTFSVILSVSNHSGAAPSAEFVDAVVSEIDRVKPLSRHFTFTQALDAEGEIGLIAAVRPATYARLSCAA